jgi:glutamyl-tRNA reductase
MTQEPRALDEASERSDPDRARLALREWADEVKREQLHEALAQLEGDGTLTAEQRRILEEMSSAIVDDLLSGPEARLASDRKTSQEVRETVFDLFDADDRRRS